MKKKIVMFLTAVCLLFSAVPCFAEEVAEPRVFDYADLLSDAEEEEIQFWAETFRQDQEMDLAFLTTNDTEGKTVQQYGADFYIAQDLGIGENYDGVIFVLDMGSREGQIVTSGKAIEIYTDYYIDQMWNNMVNDLSEGEYYDAFFTLYLDLDGYAEEYKAYLADPDGYVSEYQQSEEYLSQHEGEEGGIIIFVGIAALFALIVAGIVILGMRKSCKNVEPYTDGRAYLKENGVYLTKNIDSFVSTHTSRKPIPRDDNKNHSNWGGGSSTFSGGGGRSFGGGGGKF